MNVEDPSWVEGIPWYEEGQSPDIRLPAVHGTETMVNTGVNQAIKREIAGETRPGGNLRAMAFAQMARDALKAAGHETRSTTRKDETDVTIDNLIEQYEGKVRASKRAAIDIKDIAEEEGRGLTRDERRQLADIEEQIEKDKQGAARARALKVEEDQNDAAMQETYRLDTKTMTYKNARGEVQNPANTDGGKQRGAWPYRSSVRNSGKPAYDQVMRVGQEPHTYSRDIDPESKGEQFLSDVIGAYRGIGDAQERIARHQREWEVDNPKRQARAAGDVVSSGFPNLIVPQYLTDLYAAKPSNARPFADMCTHKDLPSEGMNVELAKGNTVTTAALQSSEMTAPAGTSHDDDPLELPVLTAENWQQVSLQAIQRGRVTEQIILNDLLDGMHTLIDSTLLTQASTGLFAAGTRLTYDDAAPSIANMYPSMLKAASQIQGTLLNRGAPSHVVMHPRRWFWLQGQLTSQWPWMTQPGVSEQSFGVNDANAYAQGRAGRLPSGLDVIVDANVPTACLAGAQTGGTQDTVFVVPQSECLLFEAPQREVFIRAEQPLAKNLGLLLVCYEFFAYTFQRYASSVMQHIDGTGTVAPAGF
jgi:hypothetical protein